MSAVEDGARAVAEAVMNHAHVLAVGAPVSEVALAGARVDQAARQYANVVDEQFGWSSPFPTDGDMEDESEDSEDLALMGDEPSALVEAMDITAVVATAAPAVDFNEVARGLLHGLERYFDEHLPTGYRAIEVGVFPRPGPAPLELGRAGLPPS